jgi:hypothetical protein
MPKGWRASLKGSGRENMSYHFLFWALCAVIAANVVVVIIAITKAYRDEGRLFFSKAAFLNGTRNLKGHGFLS